jgi:hypothetical protein
VYGREVALGPQTVVATEAVDEDVADAVPFAVEVVVGNAVGDGQAAVLEALIWDATPAEKATLFRQEVLALLTARAPPTPPPPTAAMMTKTRARRSPNVAALRPHIRRSFSNMVGGAV